jgi:hypothetical protein
MLLACPPERSSPRAAPQRDGEGKLKHTPPIGAGTSDVVFSAHVGLSDTTVGPARHTGAKTR